MASNRLFDDFARLVGDATGAAQGVRREVETMVKSQFERLLRDMDVATREELDVVRDMVLDLRLRTKASNCVSPCWRGTPVRRAPRTPASRRPEPAPGSAFQKIHPESA